MPAKITPEIAEQVCAELELGVKSLRQICDDLGFTAGAFVKRCNDDERWAQRYARARMIGNDAAFDRLREQQEEKATTVDGRIDQGWVAWKRLQIDTLKWELSKREPKKYGDKVENIHTGADGGPIQSSVTVNLVRTKGINDPAGEG